jgi:uncharacterized Zn-binding protein involved in type VI secretion
VGKPAAKRGDRVVGFDVHLIQPPGPSSPVLVPGHVFNGTLDGGLSADVNVQGQPAAVAGSTATNTPHVPIGGSFVNPPRNKAQVIAGSATVFINGKPAARLGDTALDCADPADAPVGTVQAVGTVNIGG